MKTQVIVRGVLITVFVLFIGISVKAADTEPVVGLHQNTPNVFALTNAKIITEPGNQIEKRERASVGKFYPGFVGK